MQQTHSSQTIGAASGRERPLFAVATSLILVSLLVLAPASAWFASAASDVTIVNWQLKGNAGTNPSTNFLGTTDKNPLVVRTNNIEALRVLPGSGTTGGKIGIGTTSPAFALDVKGDVNTSTKFDLAGTTVLQTPGTLNVYVGPSAGNPNGTGLANTAVGANALQNTTSGVANPASGENALLSNTSGGANTANGNGTLYDNSTGR
jgi:hypothetical protein